jgi:hypothetical protein
MEGEFEAITTRVRYNPAVSVSETARGAGQATGKSGAVFASCGAMIFG